jgi:hypothetical protein
VALDMHLTPENYYSQEANKFYMSVSQFKSFLPSYGGCEAQAMAVLNGEFTPEPSIAFKVGHYMHAWNQGVLDEFVANNPDIIARTGKYKGDLLADFKHCEKMIDVLENDPEAMRILAGQKEVIMTAEIFDIPWKIMIDSYQPEAGIFTDLKTMRSMDDKFWNKEVGVYENFVDHYGYNIQMAVYAEVEMLANNGNEWFLPHMVVVTKEKPYPDHDAIYFDYSDIEQGLHIVDKHIERVKAVKYGSAEPIRCGKCDYCKATKKIDSARHFSELRLY